MVLHLFRLHFPQLIRIFKNTHYIPIEYKINSNVIPLRHDDDSKKIYNRKDYVANYYKKPSIREQFS